VFEQQLMFILGFIVAVCYVPGYTGAFVPTQWVVLSAVLPFFLRERGQVGPIHWLGLATFAYAILSFAWSASPPDAGFGLWVMAIWFLSFHLGTTEVDLGDLFSGLAAGLAVSSLVAVFQYLGYHPILEAYYSTPPGLLFNPTVLGASCALVALALIEYRRWPYIPGVLLGLLLSQSRGAWLIFTLGLAFRWVYWPVLCLAAAAVALLATHHPISSDIERLTIWGEALRNLVPWGNGIGSFTSFYYLALPHLIHPEFVHNDPLQLLFELGPAATTILLAFGIAMYQLRSPTLFAFILLATFYFPLWCPITAFIGCTLAGRGVSAWYRSRNRMRLGRSTLLLGHPIHQSQYDPNWNFNLPTLSND
jgi:hypothetical protein